jgi:DNA-binding CsgD family transcriptional regulator
VVGKEVRDINIFKLLRNMGDYGRDRLTLQRRLFVFFLLFLVAVMSGLFLILFATGIFRAGLQESRIFLENELHHIAEDVEKDFGVASVQGIALSKRLAAQVESSLTENDLKPSDLQNASNRLESILNDCVDIMTTTLERNTVSAVFIMLNGTVNPSLDYAEHSRAGIYIKNMLPNAAYQSPSAIQYMRGPASIARERNMPLLPQWQMEFTVEKDDFFHHVMEVASSSTLPLSRLYYWNPKAALQGDSHEAMLLVLPLIATDGAVMGVCGFEISDMLFKMQYTPDNTDMPRIFAMLAPMQEEMPDASRALLAGSYTVTSAGIDGVLSVETDQNGLVHFTSPKGITYSGLYKTVNLYPKDAVHGDNAYMLSVVMPWQDLSDFLTAQNMQILILLFALLIMSATVALVLSRKYISPIVNAFGKIRSQTYSNYKKTHIQEIDDLISFLAQQDKLATPHTKNGQTSFTLFETFVKNIETLSPAERLVFNLYMEGYNAKEIADKLCLSINTIKTHNKRIYMKLDVSSRNELLVYVKMMKERDGSVDAEQ